MREQAQVIIEGVKSCNDELLSMICDGNRVTQSFFKKFDTFEDKSWPTKQNLYLLFDYVHLLKNIRNNELPETF